MRGIAPVVLSDYVDITYGTFKVFNADKLQVSDRQNIEIIEMHCVVYDVTPYNASTTVLTNLGTTIQLKLELGEYKITNGYIPIWLFGPRHDCATEVNLARSSSAAPFDVESGPAPCCVYRWILPCPLLLTQNDNIIAQVKRESSDIYTAVVGVASARTYRVQLSFVGRYLDPNIKIGPTVKVPYVTSFLGLRGTKCNISKHQDLENPFQVPYHIERINGRIEAYMLQEGNNWQVDYLGHEPILKMTDSQGYIVVQPNTPFNDVFEVGRRDWIVRRDLAPRQYYIAEVDENVASTVTNLYGLTRPMISLVGYREEVI